MITTLLFLYLMQTPPVKNPSSIEFLSPDHSRLSAYEVDIMRPDGTVSQTLTIPSSTATPGPNGSWILTLNVQPINFGTYTFVVRAMASGMKSDNSAASDDWQRVPGAPSKPLVK